jgi:DNA replication protein DnaD
MELNESKLIEREITLRNLRMTPDVSETRRSMVRWLALSLGIINPGESRLSAVAVLDAMLHFQFTEKKDPSVEEISAYITTSWEPMNEKTLRYHLLQLKKANIVNNSKGRYYFLEPSSGDKYDETAWINNYFDSEINPIKDKIAAAVKELKNR